VSEADLISSVKSRLASRGSGFQPARSHPATQTPSACGGFQEAAAVLVAFDVDALQPVAGAPGTDTREALLSISEPLPQIGSNRVWTMQTQARAAALRQLWTTSRVQAALEANPGRTRLPAQRIFESYLTGKPAPLESLSLVQLTALQPVAEWLRLAGLPGVPENSAIQNRADWFKLLQPFEHLAGEFFRGRQGELARLRSYAGVVNPGVTETVRRAVTQWFTGKLPLLVYGPGGVGKSTLVSRFILEHARAREQDRFPFIYLDFDRPEITASQPLTLLIEAVRQLGIEYPFDRERCERIRQTWLGFFRSDPQSTEPVVINPQAIASAIVEFSSLLATVGPQDSPVVMVLDTFEEVQYRSDEQVAAVWSMLSQLRAMVPRVCVIVVGRATIPGYSTEDLRLDGFDDESAVGYLTARGVSNAGLAAQIAKLVGGNPMNLHLAADLAIREGIQSASELGITTREYFFLKVDAEQIQRQLYSRVLGHVHDARVKAVAQPGLVLHRITADLIYRVLNEPCNLGLKSREEADPVFEELKREKALVRVEPDGAVVHRPELRQQTLRLLCQDEPEKVARIRREAVKYYAERTPAAEERAEEIYHRLALGEEPAAVAARWMPGVEPHLQDAFDELSGAAKAFLATRLKREVDSETLRLAGLQDWENIVKRKATDLMATRSYQDVVKLMGERPDRTVESELYSLEASALLGLGRFADAFVPLQRGIEQAIPAGARRHALLLLLQAAQMALVVPRDAVPEWLVSRLAGFPESSLPPEDRVALNARKIALAGRDYPLRADAAADIDANLRSAFDEVADTALARHPEIGWWAATAFGAGDVARLRRVIANGGIPQSGVERQLRELATRLTTLDLTVDPSASGALARSLDIPIVSTLTATWSEFLLSGRSQQVRDALVRVLGEHQEIISPDLMRAFADLMRAGLGIIPAVDPAPAATPAPAAPAARVASPRTRGLAKAIADAFTPLEFDAFLRLRLDWSLDSISTAADTFQDRVARVVEWAASRGWLNNLVEAARQSQPGSAALMAAASELGIPTLLPPTPELSKLIGRSDPSSVDEWRNRLGLIEPCVCRIEGESGRLLGTGFLVGPDLILTAAHVLEGKEFSTPQPQVRVRFDRASTGVVELMGDWLVVSSATDKLDFTIVRLRTSPGSQPIGTARAESSAALRGWIHLETASNREPGGQSICVYFGRGAPSARLALGRQTGISPNRVSYDWNVEAGASGAPCFDRDFRISGIVTGMNGRQCFGTPIGAVNQYLIDQGWGGILGTRLM